MSVLGTVRFSIQ